MARNKIILTVLGFLALGAVAAVLLLRAPGFGHRQEIQVASRDQHSRDLAPPPLPANTASSSSPAPQLYPPLTGASSRVTKKPFGLYVTPASSPVSPERFKGFHTGTDFETFPEEQDKDVPVYAVCGGKLLAKRSASGYGGVVVQSCTLDSRPVTVVYGHLKLSSVTMAANSPLKAGDRIGMLGRGFSSETDGERKHLHLGIHKGTAINIAGYVQKAADLGNWLDAQKYLP